MRARGARGLLLFSFAFTAVLSSSAEILVPSKNIDANTGSKGLEINTNGTQNKEMIIDHGVEKRAAFFSQTDKKKPEDSIRDSNIDLDRGEFDKIEKPEGCNLNDVEYCAKLLRTSTQNEELNKREKKSYDALLGGKRAPQAFHGMRGKKTEDYDTLEPSIYEFRGVVPNREFLINSGLLDDVEKVDYPDFRYRKQEDESFEDGTFSKRSPYSFQGMRGKKENFYDFKRTMGFLGMRGKKEMESWDTDGNYKRVPQNSFFGMKGKKASYSGFFGMRGKKASPSAFFAMKGKREPQINDVQDISLLNQMNGSDSTRNRIRRGITWLRNSKKAKNAFFGVRGKKSTQDSSDDNF